MEEQVGIRWHNLVTRLAEGRADKAPVVLDDMLSRLTTVLRAVGGDAGLSIRPASERKLAVRRNLLQKIAGTGRRYSLPWRDEEGLRLQARFDSFSSTDLNTDLALWLVALGAQSNSIVADVPWIEWNRRLCSIVLTQYPGMGDIYQRLVAAHLPLRPKESSLSGAQLARERCIRQALTQPHVETNAAPAVGDPYPVPVWLYPERNAFAISQRREDVPEEDGGDKPNRPEHHAKQRKRAEQVDDIDGRDGLLVFRLESMFSWSEYIPLDRTADDDDEDSARTAEDLDHLSITRNRSKTASRIRIDLDLPSAAEDDVPLTDGNLFPEWDWRVGVLKPNQCRVIPFLPKEAEPSPLPTHLGKAAAELIRRFESIRPQSAWRNRQADGSELDMSACVTYHASRHLGTASSDPRLWRRTVSISRDLACLVLADLSLSTEAAVDEHHQVIDLVKDSLQLMGEALEASGDHFAMYGFSSRRRDHVRMTLIKNFSDKWNDSMRGRVKTLKPGYYTRMGAAIRQATDILKQHPAQQRLLLLLTDGKPNDLDIYEGRYGMEDTRHAIIEAKSAGLQPFCVTIEQEAADYLPHLFGTNQYYLLRKVHDLPKMLPQIYLLLTGRDA